MSSELPEGGPFFDDLHCGQLIQTAPSLTLTSGHAALHQAIIGDRLRLALDADLSRSVLEADAPLAHPALVWDVAIGQSTVVTQRVIANLFYRGLVFHRAPVIGDTLHTTTEVVALRQNAVRPNRPRRGMAVMRIRTVDQHARPVLDFWRCAMLPISTRDVETDHSDDFDAIPAELPGASLAASVSGWRLDRLRDGRDCSRELQPGQRWSNHRGDVVSSAPELARLTLNIASIHHDASARGRRLVYGGHTIGIAAAQLTRVLPDLVTIVGWHGCDHTGPVFEGDTLTSEVELERLDTLPRLGGLAHLRSTVRAIRVGTDEVDEVLDWRLIALVV